MIVLLEIFLGILLLILLLLTVLLWVPFRYEGRMQYNQDFFASGKISFFLRIFVLTAVVERKKNVSGCAFTAEDRKEEPVLQLAVRLFYFFTKSISLNDGKGKRQNESENKPDKSEQEKVHSVRSENIYSFLRDIREDEKTREKAVSAVKKLLKTVLPRKLSGRVHFGFEDPSATGRLLALVSCFYPLFRESVTVEPDFAEAVLEGEMFFKGRFSIGVLGILGLRIYMNRRIRNLIHQYFGGQDEESKE